MFSIKLSHLTSTKHSLFIQPTSINWTPNTGQVVFQHLQTQHWPRSTSWLSRITCPWSKLAPLSNHTLDILFGKHQQPAAWWPYLDIIPQLYRLQKLKGDILEGANPLIKPSALILGPNHSLLKSPTQGISYEALRQALCGSRAFGGGGRHLEDVKVDRSVTSSGIQPWHHSMSLSREAARWTSGWHSKTVLFQRFGLGLA